MGATGELSLPQSINLEPEMRKIVLAGVKFILARLKQNNVIETDTKYNDVLLTPHLLQKYIDLVRDNLELGKDLFVDRTGKPVLNMETPLVCGATLGELERMLVYTCASKLFVKSVTPKVVVEKKKKKGFRLFGRKEEDVADEETKEKIDEGALKLAELKPHLMYAWQLPLVDAYQNLQREHYQALGETLLFLDTPEKVLVVASLSPGAISDVRNLTEDRFEKILRVKPRAITGMSQIKSKAKFDFLFKTAKVRVFDFFAREPQYVTEILGVHEDFVWALDESIADMSMESLPVIVRLKMPFLKVFMEVFREEFGDFSKIILREPEFAHVYLKPIVEDFANMMSGDGLSNAAEDAVGDIVSLKWKNQKDDILAWYKALKQARKEADDEKKKIARLTKRKLK